MRFRCSQRFLRSYAKAPAQVRKQFDKQANLLFQDRNHPSLCTKKYDETRGIRQARVNQNWRFYFTIEGEIYYLHEIKPHPK
jgi:plasmid maintenance system killer protein